MDAVAAFRVGFVTRRLLYGSQRRRENKRRGWGDQWRPNRMSRQTDFARALVDIAEMLDFVARQQDLRAHERKGGK